MQTNCEQIKKEYEEIIALNKTFVLEYGEVKEKGDLTRAKGLKRDLEKKVAELKDKLWGFEKLTQKEVREQYESQKAIMEGILEKLSTGEMGIKGINGKEYAFPEFQEIRKRMMEKKELLKEKKKDLR